MSEREIEQKPGLISVCWSGSQPPQDDTLHRADSEAACSHQPSTQLTTDLTTAAVTDGNALCSRCEWPDGCEEVLQS